LYQLQAMLYLHDSVPRKRTVFASVCVRLAHVTIGYDIPPLSSHADASVLCQIGIDCNYIGVSMRM